MKISIPRLGNLKYLKEVLDNILCRLKIIEKSCCNTSEQNLSINKTVDTEDSVDMSYILGNYCNMLNANNNEVFNLVNVEEGGKAIILINTINEPVVNGATKISGYGVEWVTQNPYYLIIENNGDETQYYYKQILESPLPDLSALPFAVIINEETVDPATIHYGTPSIVKTNTGRYLASHDYFSGASGNTTTIFYSDDGGYTWTEGQTLTGMFWGKLFEYNNEQYIIGTTVNDGDISISKSIDNGETWTNPVSIIPAVDNGWAKSADNVIFRDGYILLYGGERLIVDFAANIRVSLLYGDLTDLMNPANWGYTTPLLFDGSQLPATIWSNTSAQKRPSSSGNGSGTGTVTKGVLEGQVYEEGGNVKMLMRLEQSNNSNYAAIYNINWDSVTPSNTTIDPTIEFIEMPGGNVKFPLVWDSVTSKFWTVVTINRHRYYADCRIESFLMSCDSPSTGWTVHEKVTGYPVTTDWEDEIESLGTQYKDMVIDGDDLLTVSRTANYDTINYHNANILSFNKVYNFRTSPAVVYPEGSLVIDESSERLEDGNGIAILRDQSFYHNSPYRLNVDNSLKLSWDSINEAINFDGIGYMPIRFHEYLTPVAGFTILAVIDDLQDVAGRRIFSHTESSDPNDIQTDSWSFSTQGLTIGDCWQAYSDLVVNNNYILSASYDAVNDHVYQYLNGVNRGVPDSVTAGVWNTDHIERNNAYVFPTHYADIWMGNRNGGSDIIFNSKIKALLIIPEYRTPAEMATLHSTYNTKYSIY